MRRAFNKKLFDYLKKYGEYHTLKEWIDIINAKFNENFTLKDTQMYFARHDIPFKYEKVKKSNTWNALPIGSERVKADGMVQVKVAPRKWEYKQRLIYEQYYGVKLTSDDYIVFLDQDRTNFDISNLKRISRRESSILSNQKMFSHNPNITNLGINVAKVMIKTKEKEKKINKINKMLTN